MGIQKMKEVMVGAGLHEPTFEPNGFFRAIFQRSPEFAMKSFRDTETQSPEELVERLAEGLAESQKRILQLICRNPRISKKTMAEAIGISTTAIDKNLAKLKKRGILRRVGPARGGHWKVVR